MKEEAINTVEENIENLDETTGGIAFLDGMDEGLDEEEMEYQVLELDDSMSAELLPDLRAMHLLDQLLGYLVYHEESLNADDLELVGIRLLGRINDMVADINSSHY